MPRLQAAHPAPCCSSSPRLLVSACGSRPPRPPAVDESITLYNGQHEQTTARARDGVRKADGDQGRTCAPTTRRRSATRSSRRARTRRRTSSTPRTPPSLEALRREGHAGDAAAPATLSAIPSTLQLRRRATGSASPRASRRSSTTPPRSQPAQLPSSILELAEPKWKGKLGFAPSETDFQPLITSIIKLDGAAAAEHWLKGLQGQRQDLPRQRDRRRRGQQRRERASG